MYLTNKMSIPITFDMAQNIDIDMDNDGDMRTGTSNKYEIEYSDIV